MCSNLFFGFRCKYLHRCKKSMRLKGGQFKLFCKEAVELLEILGWPVQMVLCQGVDSLLLCLGAEPEAAMSGWNFWGMQF